MSMLMTYATKLEKSKPSISGLFTIFHFDLENFVHLGENTSKYCSWIIVVHVHATEFF